VVVIDVVGVATAGEGVPAGCRWSMRPG